MRSSIRWAPRITLLSILSLWIMACFGVPSDTYLFQHGKRTRMRIRAAYDDEHIIGRRSLSVSTRGDYVVIEYERMPASMYEKLNPTFSTSIGAAPSFWPLSKPRIENTRSPDPDDMVQDYVQVPMPPAMQTQVLAGWQAAWGKPYPADQIKYLTVSQPVGPLHRGGPVDPAMQTRVLVVGIPYWLIFLPAAIVSSLQLVRWWRRGRKEGRGFSLHNEAPSFSSDGCNCVE